jgi:peptide-methionine (S)-S-oxide reductase
MPRRLRQLAPLVVAACAVAGIALSHAAPPAVQIPPPAADITPAATTGPQTAVLAGGCFWGIEAVFRHVKGVSSAVSGYAGGLANEADYPTVSSGTTGHAESVKVTYDPAQVSYGQLLQVFFSVAHNPTELNRQGPDTGTQYRSAIFTTSPEQERVAKQYIRQLDQAKAYRRPIVTQVTPLPAFYPAEAYHQNYAALHPRQPYIAINDLPKVDHLREQFPSLYTGQDLRRTAAGG